MRAALASLAAAAIVALAAVAFAPATFVDSRIAMATDGRMHVANADGTALRGTGTLADAGGLARIPIEWSASLPAALRGVLDVDVRLPASSSTTRVRADGDRLRIEKLAARVPAAAFADAAVVGGDVLLASNALDIEAGRARGDVRIEWQRARIAPWPGSVVDFGTVVARLSGTGGPLAGPIEARGGEVTADGIVTVDGGALRLDAELAPAPSAPAAVRDILARLGPADAGGAVRVSLVRDLR